MTNENCVHIQSIFSCFLCCPMKISVVFNFLCVQILFQSVSSQLSFKALAVSLVSDFFFFSKCRNVYCSQALCGSASVRLCDGSTWGSVWSCSGHSDDVLSLPMKLACGVRHLCYRCQPYSCCQNPSTQMVRKER